MKLDNNIDTLINEIVDQDDVSEIKDQIALFCYNFKIMPGSEEFDYVMDYIWFNFFMNMNTKVIQQVRILIDEYE